LDLSKLCGPDNIPAHVLKYCSEQIPPILTVIFTHYLSSGNLPDDWLTGNVTLIFKKRRQSYPRQLSTHLLNSHMLYTTRTYHRITEHLNTYQILSDKLYEFSPNHSCKTQLLSAVEEIQLAMDHHFSIDLKFINFRKAFDTVPHKRLLKKYIVMVFRETSITGYLYLAYQKNSKSSHQRSQFSICSC